MENRASRKFALDRTNGKLMGVCAGIGNYLKVDPLWVRVATVASVLVGFGLAIPLYFAIGFLADKA